MEGALLCSSGDCLYHNIFYPVPTTVFVLKVKCGLQTYYQKSVEL